MTEARLSRRIIGSALAVSAAATFVTSCTASGSGEGSSSAAPAFEQSDVPAITPSAAPTLSPLEQVVNYQNSATRNRRLQAAAQEFGQAVLQQAALGNASAWAPFDTFCFTPNSEGDITRQGYRSQGFASKPGDICHVAHSSEYGGKPVSIEADVAVGSNGAYDANRINTVWIDDAPGCAHAEISNTAEAVYGTPPSGAWDAQWNNYYSGVATTLEGAQRVDDLTLACFNGLPQ